ncbi:MAG: hypothetical protein ACP6IQ_06310 [Candidatus Njordarchaeia archaeon]
MLIERKDLILLVIFYLLGVSLHYLIDIIHIPLYFDKYGMIFAAYILGPIWSGFIGLATALTFSVTDLTYFIRSIPWLISGVLFGLAFKNRKIEMKPYVKLALISLAIIAIPVGDFLVYTVIAYYPLESHVLEFSSIFNLFMNQFIDVVITLLISLLLIRNQTKIKIPNKKFAGIDTTKLLSIIVLLIVLIPSFLINQTNDTALDGRIPVPEGWTYVVTRMDFVWSPMGAKGVNYYLYPPGRFNRSDPGYQVWFGVYWVQGRYGIFPDHKYDAKAIYAFSIIDQDFWLGLHGKKDPKTTVHAVHKVYWGTVDNYEALIMFGSYDTQSDVSPYENVLLEGFLIVLYIQKYDRTAIVYACAVDRYWPVMNSTLWNLAMNIDFP